MEEAVIHAETAARVWLSNKKAVSWLKKVRKAS